MFKKVVQGLNNFVQRLNYIKVDYRTIKEHQTINLKHLPCCRRRYHCLTGRSGTTHSAFGGFCALARHTALCSVGGHGFPKKAIAAKALGRCHCFFRGWGVGYLT
jgi:hypothetical protein